MGLSGTWNPDEVSTQHEQRAIAAFEAALEAGITFFDHADIYGGGSCESVFKKCLEAVPGSREKITIATKGSIGGGQFNASYEYLDGALRRSMERLGVDYVDIYQIHRPDPLTHPRETAKFLNDVVRSGKVRHVGVSNYFPEQLRALQTYLDVPIVSNQFEIHLLRLDPVYEGWQVPQTSVYTQGGGGIGDGLLDQCMALDITPLAYSPLAGGKLARFDDVKAEKSGGENGAKETKNIEADVKAKLRELAPKYDATPSQIAIAWLLKHPSGIVPLVGSANPDHIREGAGAAKIELSRDDWYELWKAGWGRNMP